MKLSDGLHSERPSDSPGRCAVSDLACQEVCSHSDKDTSGITSCFVLPFAGLFFSDVNQI